MESKIMSDEEKEKGLTAEEQEMIMKLVEEIDEIITTIKEPVDPRVSALLAIASDYLLQQVEDNRKYVSDEEMESNITKELEGTQDKLSVLRTNKEQKSLGDKMADDISKWLEENEQ